jgi:hypothetical protein
MCPLQEFADYVKHLEERIARLEKLLIKQELAATFEGTPVSVSMLPL